MRASGATGVSTVPGWESPLAPPALMLVALHLTWRASCLYNARLGVPIGRRIWLALALPSRTRTAMLSWTCVQRVTIYLHRARL